MICARGVGTLKSSRSESQTFSIWQIKFNIKTEVLWTGFKWKPLTKLKARDFQNHRCCTQQKNEHLLRNQNHYFLKICVLHSGNVWQTTIEVFRSPGWYVLKIILAPRSQSVSLSLTPSKMRQTEYRASWWFCLEKTHWFRWLTHHWDELYSLKKPTQGQTRWLHNHFWSLTGGMH